MASIFAQVMSYVNQILWEIISFEYSCWFGDIYLGLDKVILLMFR